MLTIGLWALNFWIWAASVRRLARDGEGEGWVFFNSTCMFAMLCLTLWGRM